MSGPDTKAMLQTLMTVCHTSCIFCLCIRVPCHVQQVCIFHYICKWIKLNPIKYQQRSRASFSMLHRYGRKVNTFTYILMKTVSWIYRTQGQWKRWCVYMSSVQLLSCTLSYLLDINLCRAGGYLFLFFMLDVSACVRWCVRCAHTRAHMHVQGRVWVSVCVFHRVRLRWMCLSVMNLLNL